MFVWMLSIDPPVSDRATWSLPLLLVSTLKLSNQTPKQSIPQSWTIMPFQVVSRCNQQKISPASQHVQTDVSWTAPTLRIKVHLFSPDNKLQRERRHLVPSPK
jgi:hypothetical protein